ncbi:uncharacterized protein [Musca autumnalis]|uniref:uncharacterized protein n=1 Tax=Musca autumnalis TaxID=221902 RepID=UPI003CE6DE2D
MEHTNEKETNFLLDSIRNELVAIIDEESLESKYDEPKQQNIINRTVAKDTLGDTKSMMPTAKIDNITYRCNLPQPEGHCLIDEDLQRMNINLKESYQLFQTIGDRFENINFACLKSRIRDMHLDDKNSDIKSIVHDLKNTFDQKYVDNRLGDLTKEMGSKFRRHPGEFGDIPELSEFFKACTQLQHGLEKLKRQRNDVQDITKRMSHIIESSCNRVNELQKQLELESEYPTSSIKLQADEANEQKN